MDFLQSLKTKLLVTSLIFEFVIGEFCEGRYGVLRCATGCCGDKPQHCCTPSELNNDNFNALWIFLWLLLAALVCTTVFVCFRICLVSYRHRIQQKSSGSRDAQVYVIPKPPDYDSLSPSESPPKYEEVVLDCFRESHSLTDCHQQSPV